jgi:hypothetical protein
MKRVAILMLLALALPVATWASSSIDVVNVGGTLAGSSSGMTLSGSTLIKVDGISGTNLGTLQFSTGSLISGDLQNGGVFAGGGSFVITGNGSNGAPSGVIFNGSFTGNVTWTHTMVGSNNFYTLSGSVAGGGMQAATVQLTISTGTKPFSGSTSISSGDTNLVTVVPEPGTLGLLGTGLLGVAGLVRRKMRST